MPPLTAKNLPKIWERSGKKRNNQKGANQEDSFTLPVLTDRAGYATLVSGIITEKFTI